MRKNILNTKSGNLEMSQCLHYTPRSKTYCGKGRINNMKFFPSHFSLFGYHMKINVSTTNPPFLPLQQQQQKTDVTSHPYLPPHDGHLPTTASHLHPKVVVVVVICQAHAHHAYRQQLAISFLSKLWWQRWFLLI